MIAMNLFSQSVRYARRVLFREVRPANPLERHASGELKKALHLNDFYEKEVKE